MIVNVADIDRDELAVFLRGTAGYNLATVLSPGEARFLVDEILDYLNGRNAK